MEIVHNFCESRLQNHTGPEYFNSYSSIVITFIPIYYGLPKNYVLFNISILLMLNGLASFYYHYFLNFYGKQLDEINMILLCYLTSIFLIKIYDNNLITNYLFTNIYCLLFVVLNTNIENDILFPFLFTYYILYIIYLLNLNFINHNYIYKYELIYCGIGSTCWLISEFNCNYYTKYGHVLWHLLFPLGFYKIILNYDKKIKKLDTIY